jgi:hypothetical protein
METKDITSEELRMRLLVNQKESDFDKELMAFAMLFHKEQSNQMQEKIKELEDLLLKVRNYYLFGNDFETGEPKASIKELMEFWEKANEALNK